MRRKGPVPAKGLNVARDLTVSGQGNTVAGHDVSQHFNIEKIVLNQTRNDAAPNLLPPDASDFCGRTVEIEMLEKKLLASDHLAVTISAVDGRAGVGKSALAVHVAHRLSSRFVDGQLYINLYGADQRPLQPTDALTELLYVGLGVSWESQPSSLTGKAAMWRRLLADKRMLVVLDNALDEKQVRPLVPGSSETAVLVTSRRMLSALGAEHIRLGRLTDDQSLELLAKIAGEECVLGDRAAALKIAEFCDGLPLALRIAGAKLAARSDWLIGDLVDRLADERRRLSHLKTGDLEVSASLQLSYRGLSSESSAALRFLTLWPGSDFASWVVAALLECTVGEAESVVDDLVREQLIEPIGHGRYRMHDLVRLFAHEMLLEGHSEVENGPEWERLTEAAIALANEMDEAIRQRHGDVSLDRESALRWFEDERANLVAAVLQAVQHGRADLGERLAGNLREFVDRRAYKRDLTEISEAVVAGAEQTQNRDNMIKAYFDLSRAYDREGRFIEAEEVLYKCRDVIQEQGDRFGDQGLDKAFCLAQLAHIYGHQDRNDEAEAALLECVQFLQAKGDRHHEALYLTDLAKVRMRQNRLADAIGDIDTAVSISRELGHLNHVADHLYVLGDIQLKQGQLVKAEESLREAVQLCRRLSFSHREADSLHRLAHVLRDQGAGDQVESTYFLALNIFRELKDLNCERDVLSCLGHYFQVSGRFDEAEPLLRQASAISHEIDDIQEEIESLRCLEALYRKVGRISEADACHHDIAEKEESIT